ncbi:MAG: TonB-dependent receptor [Sphingomonas sp.]|uniref:TonB-dependent receptor n=1 Tax=Sphingomonas sp. TaxID=28214 RepID=UPI003F81BEE0
MGPRRPRARPVPGGWAGPPPGPPTPPPASGTPAPSDQSATQPGAAADGDIVVTATRRSESVRNIPISISAISQDQLQRAGALEAKDVVRLVPGLAYTENSSGQAILAVRGVQTSAVFGNLQQAVALYHDDVPVLDLVIPWTVPRLQLFDVERVEVLRGPQGTLFGAGALSGAIRVISNKPNLTEVSGATDDTVSFPTGGNVGGSLNAMVNIPLMSDQLAVRAVGFYDFDAGWIDNPNFGKNTNRGKLYGGRFLARWKPVENLDIIASASIEVNEPHDSAYTPYGSNTDIATYRVRNYNTDNTKIFSLNATYTMPWATLTSSTSYLKREATSSLDFSGYANVLTGLTTASPLLDRFNTRNFVQEVRLASSSEHPFKWLIGGFYEDYKLNLLEQISQQGVAGTASPYGGLFPTNYLEDIGVQTKIRDYAVFGEASYDIVPGLTFTAGARYSHYKLETTNLGGISGQTLFDGPPSTVAKDASNSAFSPKFSLSYKPNKDAMIYVSASKGFRTGNTNLASPIDPFTGQSIPQSFGPDTLWNYEAGVKLGLLDNHLTINAAAFYIDWKKIQLQVRTSSGIPYTANAGSATSKGLELELVARPTRSFEMGTSLAYTDAKLKSVTPGVPIALVGDRLPGSAPFTAYVYGQYSAPLAAGTTLLLRADYSYTGRQFADLGNFNNPNAVSYGDYSEVGARATIRSGPYEFGLFVQNLLNERSRISARTFFLEVAQIRQKPRTFGVNVSAKW